MTDMELQALHKSLKAVLHDIERSPDWCDTTTKGHLAEADWEVVQRAASVVHRLGLWRRYSHLSEESYLAELVT